MRDLVAEGRSIAACGYTESQMLRYAKASSDEIERLRREVDVLRIYGNKDCTAMADEHLASVSGAGENDG